MQRHGRSVLSTLCGVSAAATQGGSRRLGAPDRLSGLDASFLYNETATEHMHTLKLAVLDPPEVTLTTDAMREAIGSRMERWPAFVRRVVRVPGDLHHPVWVNSAELDLDHHVVTERIPDPGDDAAMDLAVGRLAGVPLDRSRPLWQVVLLEGRADGRMAVLVKLHHCVADGLAANALLQGLVGDGASPPGAGEPTPTPGGRRLLADASVDLVADLRRLPAVMAGVRRATGRRSQVLADLRRSGGELPPRPILDTPRTSLNRAISAERSVATTRIDLRPVLGVRAREEVSVNDVFLTLVGGALTDVLRSRGEHPHSSLTASVPVASEVPDPAGAGLRRSGNKLSNLFVSLHTELTDPTERLHAVHTATSSAKRLHDALGAEVMESLLAYTPPKPYRWAMKTYSGLDLADRHRAPANVIASNVPGPRESLEVAGARIVDFYSAGPVLEGIGVNVTAWSYTDHMDIMVIACARALPEPRRVTDAMCRELARLSS